MNKKHKHYDCIVAWAEGKEIQYYDNNEWKDCGTDPMWCIDFNFRIKQEKKVIRFRNYLRKTTGCPEIFVFEVSKNTEWIDIEKYSFFIKWIGDWQEVEVDEL